MNSPSCGPESSAGTDSCRAVSILLWLTLSTGWLVSTFSVIQEMCMVSACRDTAGFTIFGFNMGWFGIAYFTLILIVLWRRKNDCRLDWLLAAMIFSGVGAEFRLLWIQKFVIGGWCPLCVTICCALFCAALLLLINKVRSAGTRPGVAKNFVWWLVLVATMMISGLAIAVVGVKALY